MYDKHNIDRDFVNHIFLVYFCTKVEYAIFTVGLYIKPLAC